jgi:hypothetical protein
MRGAQNFYHFGVLKYVVMIEIGSAPQEVPLGCNDTDEEFLRRHHVFISQ